MALSLVGDYGGTDSSSEESGDESEVEQTKPTKSQVSLPSAADLFDSVEVGAASFMSAPPTAESPLITPKRKEKPSGGGGGSSAKTSKTSSGAKEAGAGAGAGEKTPSRGLIPPQMNRPNIVTEDSSLWSSDAAVKRKRQMEAEKRGAAKAKGAGAAGGKDSLSYKQREKAKRDKGQASRGKSYVEEEKRLLRELGSS